MAETSFKPLEATTETLEKLLKTRPVLWVGAGTSIAAGYPSTWELVKAMQDASFDPIDGSLPFTEIADRFIKSNTHGELNNLLQKLIGASHNPTPTLKAVARMAADDRFAAIITTNYDTLLERVLADAGVDHVVQTIEKGFELNDDGQLRLLKIHGSKEDWSKTILSGDSYAKFKDRYERLIGQLNQFLTQRRILFVGCSMKDPRILDWIDETEVEERKNLQIWAPILTVDGWQSALDEHGMAPRLSTPLPSYRAFGPCCWKIISNWRICSANSTQRKQDHGQPQAEDHVRGRLDRQA